MKTQERCEDGAAQESARGQKGAGTDETAAGRGGGWAPPGELHIQLPAEDFPAPGIWARPVSCFAQWSISGRDVNKGLKYNRRVGQPIDVCRCRKENILWSHWPSSQDPSTEELPCLPRACGGR